MGYTNKYLNHFSSIVDLWAREIFYWKISLQLELFIFMFARECIAGYTHSFDPVVNIFRSSQSPMKPMPKKRVTDTSCSLIYLIHNIPLFLYMHANILYALSYITIPLRMDYTLLAWYSTQFYMSIWYTYSMLLCRKHSSIMSVACSFYNACMHVTSYCFYLFSSNLYFMFSHFLDVTAPY